MTNQISWEDPVSDCHSNGWYWSYERQNHTKVYTLIHRSLLLMLCFIIWFIICQTTSLEGTNDVVWNFIPLDLTATCDHLSFTFQNKLQIAKVAVVFFLCGRIIPFHWRNYIWYISSKRYIWNLCVQKIESDWSTILTCFLCNNLVTVSWRML